MGIIGEIRPFIRCKVTEKSEILCSLNREQGKMTKNRVVFLESICLVFKGIVIILDREKLMNRREKAYPTNNSK